MKTSYFARFDKLVRRGEDGIVAEQGISIARSMPRGTTCIKQADMLAPSKELLNGYMVGKINWGQYKEQYEMQLAISDPQEWYDYFIEQTKDFGEPILLCWENTDYKPCHRILVANWLEEALGIKIVEL